MDYGTTLRQREFGLAAWLLISDGTDMMSSDQLAWTAPDTWWTGYDLNLGAAQGPWSATDSLITRHFDCGMVVLNQPGEPTASYDIGAEATNLDGETMSSVSLAGGTAAILTWPCHSRIRPLPPTNVRVTCLPGALGHGGLRRQWMRVVSQSLAFDRASSPTIG